MCPNIKSESVLDGIKYRNLKWKSIKSAKIQVESAKHFL